MGRGKAPRTPPAPAPITLVGIAGSAGFAIGTAVVVDTRRAGIVHRRIPKHHAEDELARFDAAVRVAAEGLREVAAKMGGARAERSILEAYVLMVEDETLRSDVERRIQIDLQCAEWALDVAVQEMAAELSRARDPYLAERSHDIEFIGDRILRAITGKERLHVLPDTPEPSILVAHNLSPAETAGLSKNHVLAMVTELGTRTSHTAIVARALEIPAVVGVGEMLAKIANGDHLIVDGVHGHVTINPTEDMLDRARARADRYGVMTRSLRELRDRAPATKCGTLITIQANIEMPSDAEIALDQGAQGIGLYRTEFLYLDRTHLPSEDEQYEIYRRVVESMSPLPVTLRTFDLGGDKMATVLGSGRESNPALGMRAIRLGLEHPELLSTQLRAMVRASAHGPLSIMVPMVATVHELSAVKELLQRAFEEVDAAGRPRAAHIPLGMMVEVPSAALLANHFARHAEFLSIGTNDLVQYTLAVDRGSRELAHLASFFDPAVLRLIELVIAAGKEHERRVVVCGAMSSDPLAAILLVGMGLRELSLEASAIPEVKEAISRVTLEEVEAVAKVALEYEERDQVERLLAEHFGPRLADLLDSE